MVKIGINGFGRIGRIVARQLYLNPAFRKNIKIVAVNDLSDPKDLAFCMKYDSTHGALPLPVGHDAESITIDGDKIHCLKQPDPQNSAGTNSASTSFSNAPAVTRIAKARLSISKPAQKK